ncbi:hypothetical protein CQW49_15100 [Methylosinus trichosporium OB3b]|uniref:Aminoglycoside phosphotransferase domain-containing protein n=1 Tax=Methylosinus trichosporium (strain ATCC 35070 / NCIMB 11131 / UNIQEM 75 / OB3b) TaxID=595536 RepID=A0A2D2D253_METT3|nr:phosphotransferase [Methylosinus trichosporium]ATQ69054.1 hypothetical protein CQW49_15100 [Methylosinus trichosporium OB3b]
MDGDRREVFCLGATLDSPVVRELENRSCVVHLATPDDVPVPVERLRAVLVCFTPADIEPYCAWVSTHVQTLADYGVRLELVSPDDATLGQVQSRVGPALKLASVRARTAPPVAALAENIARHFAGARPRMDLKIVVADEREPIRKADEPLFKRAFHLCREVTLVELTGGRSAARVFAAHMTVEGSEAGVWPQPAFVKLDRSDKVAREHANYRDYAERFIPFGLRPNIQALVAGAERSLLVGDFVDRSESLWDLAQREVAAQAVTSLIDETLRGWRDQGYASDPVSGSLAIAMRDAGLWNPEAIVAGYVEKAWEAGVRVTPADLMVTLSAMRQMWRHAPVHGDLHGENVRVRNGQAILIDLASVTKGPMTADLAALETWLAFELPLGVDASRFGDPEWTSQIDRLYAPSAFRHPPGPCAPAARLRWMAAVVRQLRTMGIAAQSCPTEYQTAVAVQLLRRCQWDDGPAADRFRRGYGYLTAVRLIEDANGGVR